MPKKPKVDLAEKIRQWPSEAVHRSKITGAPYNPRVISERARKLLKDNLKTRGLMGGIVWNKTTGNLVSGHQRLEILDAVYKTMDYDVQATVVELTPEEEREQNLFLNNASAQGVFDRDKFFALLESSIGPGGPSGPGMASFSLDNAGFSLFDIEMQFGSVPDFLRPAKTNLGIVGGQALADHESGVKADLDMYRQAIQEARLEAAADEKKAEVGTGVGVGVGVGVDIDTSKAPDRNSPGELKDRKSKYAQEQEKIGNVLDQDADYAVLLVFRSRLDKEAFITKAGIKLGAGKFINADDIEAIVVDKAKWR